MRGLFQRAAAQSAEYVRTDDWAGGVVLCARKPAVEGTRPISVADVRVRAVGDARRPLSDPITMAAIASRRGGVGACMNSARDYEWPIDLVIEQTGRY